MKNLLFITCYNCADQIQRVITKLNHVNINDYFDEILVINNISTDKTEAVAIDTAKKFPNLNIKVIRNHQNYSLGGSHKVAFNYAIDNNFDFVAVLHGDDQGDISNLLPYMDNKQAFQYDSFLGSRFMLKSRTHGYSIIRILGNIGVNIYTSVLSFRVLKDMGSGLNMYKVAYLKNRFYMNFPNTLNFNVYLLLYGVFVKSKFTFFPLVWKEEDQISNAKVVKQGLEIVKLYALYFFNKKHIFKKSYTSIKNYTFDIMYSGAKND